MRIPFERLQAEFKRVLLRLNFTEERADACAHIFAQNSLDGVYSHGLNRFPAFVQYTNEGLVKPNGVPVLVDQMGAIERWDGQFGPGVLNAAFCMDRAMELAKNNGISCVALRHTNHWMRGGTYGWQAAEAGYIAICFTNTKANVTPWGGLDPRLGNNPLVIAIPRKDGHVVLDMAMSQYSYGKLLQYKANNQELPFVAGYDEAGHLTTNPGAIVATQRGLPIGFWKGAGLSLMLDLLATVLSKGKSTGDVSQHPREYGVSQVFMCIKPQDDELTQNLIEQIISYTKTSVTGPDNRVQYPGEGTLKIREQNLKEGIPVDEAIWEQVLGM